jgi:hypothetical protein
MAMSEFIRNLDVSLKLFLLLRDWFYIYYAKRSTTAQSDRKTRTDYFFLWFTGTQATTDSESRRK